jgi:hypothetical protein
MITTYAGLIHQLLERQEEDVLIQLEEAFVRENLTQRKMMESAKTANEDIIAAPGQTPEEV